MGTVLGMNSGTWLVAGGLVLAAGGNADATKASTPGSKTIPKTSVLATSSVTKAAPGPWRMHVDEPKSTKAMATARESKAWQKVNAQRGLTQSQKEAFRDRKEGMEGMIAVIKEKRMAMQNANPVERAALARDLHRMILEKESGPITVATRVSSDISFREPIKNTSGENSRPTPELEIIRQNPSPKVLEAQEVNRERLREKASAPK